MLQPSIFEFTDKFGMDSPFGNWLPTVTPKSVKIDFVAIGLLNQDNMYFVDLRVTSTGLNGQRAVLAFYIYKNDVNVTDYRSRPVIQESSILLTEGRINFQLRINKTLVDPLMTNILDEKIQFIIILDVDKLTSATLPFTLSNILKQDEKDEIFIHGTKYDYIEIKRRVDVTRKKLSGIVSELNEKDDLILNLPLLEWRMGYRYAAVMVVHWLEGSSETIILEDDFFTSEGRLKNYNTTVLKEYFKMIKYLSVENVGNRRIERGYGDNIFLFDTSLTTVKNSMEYLLEKLKITTKNTPIGDYDHLPKHINDDVFLKDNFFQSFSIGSKFGDIDDVGAALGRFSLRCYFKGMLYINKNKDNKWTLSIEEIAVRFVDFFEFDGIQLLGYWRNDLTKPGVGRVPPLVDGEEYKYLLNSHFRDLRDKAAKADVSLGGDFMIYSKEKKIQDKFVQKQILIF